MTGLRERKKHRTREAIIDSALDLFERQGYDSTTVEEIAAAAEISPRTFFRYFESKLDVVTATKREEVPFDVLLAGRPAHEPLLEATRHLVRDVFAELLADDGSVLARQYRLVMSSPELQMMTLEHFHRHNDELTVAYAARLGVDTDDFLPQAMAAAVTGVLRATIGVWVESGGGVADLFELTDRAFAVLANGFEPGPTADAAIR